MAEEVGHAEGVGLMAQSSVDMDYIFAVNASGRSLRNWDLKNTSKGGITV